MRLDLIRDESSPWCKIIASGIISAFLFTIALSEVPRLHERIHPGQGAEHVCAVTMFSSGHVDQSTIDPGAAQPERHQSQLISEARAEIVIATLGISPLEHAPPALS